MPYRRVDFHPNGYYHLYNRGVNYQTIFFEKENYLFFLRRLEKHFNPEDIEVLAYCLMPNHYHLMVYLKKGHLSDLFQPFLVSYTKAINNRYGRTGPLFQGPFKAVQIEKDDYLLQLSRYIHLNPVKASLVNHPEDWEFSSYRVYLERPNENITRPETILGFFKSPLEYQQFVESQEESTPIEPLLFD